MRGDDGYILHIQIESLSCLFNVKQVRKIVHFYKL